MLENIKKNIVDSKGFSKSDIDNILLSKTVGSFYFYKNTDKNKPVYDNFNNDFSMFLSKLPSNLVKKYVTEIFNRDLIYLGSTQLAKSEGFFSRIDLTDNDELRMVILDVKELDIDVKTGDAENIDDCIYASYFSFIRACIIANRVVIKTDYKLHDLLSQYLYLIVLSVLNSKNLISSAKQKLFIKMICYYAFNRYFIKDSFSVTIKKLKNSFDTSIFEEFYPRLKDINKYESVKDIPKMLIDSKVLTIDPNVFTIELIKRFKQYGFLCIYGPLDMFAAFSIVSKYPFSLIEKGQVGEDLQGNIEDHMTQYYKKLRFSRDA